MYRTKLNEHELRRSNWLKKKIGFLFWKKCKLLNVTINGSSTSSIVLRWELFPYSFEWIWRNVVVKLIYALICCYEWIFLFHIFHTHFRLGSHRNKFTNERNMKQNTYWVKIGSEYWFNLCWCGQDSRQWWVSNNTQSSEVVIFIFFMFECITGDRPYRG